MANYRLFRQLMVGVLWLGMGASCQRDDPTTQSCSNGTCCNADSYQYNYIEYIRDMPVNINYGGESLTFSKPIPTNWQIKALTPAICRLSFSKVQNLKPLDLYVNPNGNFRYRVSGKVFDNASWITISGIPSISIYIDKIEENR